MRHTLLRIVLLTAIATPALAAPPTPAAPAAPKAAVSSPRPAAPGGSVLPDPAVMAERQLQVLDANKDNAVSEQEFLAKHKEAFARLDSNKDGKATKAELTAYYQGLLAELTKRKALPPATPGAPARK